MGAVHVRGSIPVPVDQDATVDTRVRFRLGLGRGEDLDPTLQASVGAAAAYDGHCRGARAAGSAERAGQLAAIGMELDSSRRISARWAAQGVWSVGVGPVGERTWFVTYLAVVAGTV
jgi:hypothetical protein